MGKEKIRHSPSTAPVGKKYSACVFAQWPLGVWSRFRISARGGAKKAGTSLSPSRNPFANKGQVAIFSPSIVKER